MQEFSQVPSEPAAESVQPRHPLLSLLREALETLALAIVLFLAIEFVSARVRVEGFSMLPTLQNGELVLVSKISYRFGAIQRGDIVVFRHPLNTRQELIKRVIGLPGDQVVIENGQLILNGTALVEPYISAPPRYNGRWEVPPGYLFVLGDNRNDSSDSHSWGLLPIENVIGKAILVYWPFDRMRMLQHPLLVP
ncbi:MAG: signal peptidase I [Anaerolineales bacterium]